MTEKQPPLGGFRETNDEMPVALPTDAPAAPDPTPEQEEQRLREIRERVQPEHLQRQSPPVPTLGERMAASEAAAKEEKSKETELARVDMEGKLEEAMRQIAKSELATPEAQQFALDQRMAMALSHGRLIPEAFRKSPADCLIAVGLARRVTGRAGDPGDALMVMQNLHVIDGRPAWSSPMVIALVNTSGRFSGPLQFEWKGEPGKDEWGARAHAIDKRTGEVVTGSWVTWEIAKKEGWVTRKGSKWQSIPEQMFQYRAATFFARIHCPDRLMGMLSEDEARDIRGTETVTVDVAKALEAATTVEAGAEKEAADADG